MLRPITTYHLAARQGLKVFISAVKDYDPTSAPENFRDVISISTLLFEIFISGLARHLQVPEKTILLWADGHTVPEEPTRHAAKAYILQKLSAQQHSQLKSSSR